MVRNIILQMSAVGAVFGGGLFLAGHSSLAAGFLAGVVASMSNCGLLSRQIKRVAELPAAKAAAQAQAGLLVRLTLAALLLLLSDKFAEINFIASIAGFFVFQIVMIFRAVVAWVRGMN